MYLRREDLNLRMAESKSAALPLGDAPFLINYMEIEYKCQSSNQYNTSIGQEGIRTPDTVVRSHVLQSTELQALCSNENKFNRKLKNCQSKTGVIGIEPMNSGVKVRCLTSWLHPNIFRHEFLRRRIKRGHIIVKLSFY